MNILNNNWLAQYCVDILGNGLELSVIGLAFLFILKGTRVFNVAFGAIFILSGYIYSLFYLNLHLQFYGAATLSIILVVILIIGIDYFFKWIGGSSEIFASPRTFVASFGIAIIIENICSRLFGNNAIIVADQPNRVGLEIHPIIVSIIYLLFFLVVIFYFKNFLLNHKWISTPLIFFSLLIIVISIKSPAIVPYMRIKIISIALICLLLAAIFFQTRLGKNMRLFMHSPYDAKLIGYPTEYYRLACVTIAGLLIGTQSILHIQDVAVRPDESFRFLVAGAFVAMLFRRISIMQLIISGIIFSTVSYLTVILFSSAWTDTLSYAMFFFLLLRRNPNITETSDGEI